MRAVTSLLGEHVAILPRQAPLADLVQTYRSSPEAFRRQFGRPVADLGTVLEVAESALAHGFSRYFDVRLRADDTVIGHLRLDGSLQQEGLICLHGGSPLDDPHSPGHRRRAHARARAEAWHLMVRAALATPGVERVGTATAASNRAAQAFIAASGFRRTRVLHLPDGREPQIHYRLVRAWLPPATPDGDAPLAPPGLTDWAAPLTASPCGTARPRDASDEPQGVPVPQGWCRIQAEDAAHWIEALPTDFLHQLADAPPPHASREALAQTLYFEAMHGTQFFGHPGGRRPPPARALIAVKPLPDRPGWWLLRGGPLASGSAPPPPRPWLDACFTRAGLRRVEAHIPATPGDISLAWWRGCGLAEEGIIEVDGQGLPLAYALARVAA